MGVSCQVPRIRRLLHPPHWLERMSPLVVQLAHWAQVVCTARLETKGSLLADWQDVCVTQWLADYLAAFFFFFFKSAMLFKKKGTRRRKQFNELKISWIRWGISGELHVSTLKNSSQWIRLKRGLLFPAPKRVHSPSWTVTWRRLSLKWA